MPNEMTQAHIVPGLAHSSLISTKVFCDAGCKVAFDEFECRVYFNNKLMLAGSRDPQTMLWRLPINPKAPPSADNTVARQLNPTAKQPCKPPRQQCTYIVIPPKPSEIYAPDVLQPAKAYTHQSHQ